MESINTNAREDWTMQVTEYTVVMLNDNYRIERADGTGFVGTEHNQTEAEAIARYLTNYHGQRFVAVRNPINLVREARTIRRDTIRVRERDMILKTMGVV
jgi:hypothetical protein